MKKLPSKELLSYEEILRVVSLAVELGIKKVRLTGGEPLVRRGIIPFIKKLTAIPGLKDVRLTTNGVLLADYANELLDAGIQKLNISLDTLNPERYRMITGRDFFARVMSGIKRVQNAGFSTIKINVVALKGINDDEIPAFGEWSRKEPLQIRFIEFMPVGNPGIWGKERYLPADEIMAALSILGRLTPLKTGGMEGPARLYHYRDAAGSIGLISPISSHFCDQCNRLRLTSEGRLRACLLTDRETDLKTILRTNGSDEDIKNALIQTILDKPKGHTLPADGAGSCHGQMSRIGG